MYNISISTYEENTLLFKEHVTGDLEDNILKFNTETDSMRINLKEPSLKKDNVESTLLLTKDKCTLYVKELKNSLDIPIDYIRFINEENYFEVEYELISQEKPLKICINIERINENEI